MKSQNKTRLIGFSTAFLHHTYSRVSKEIIRICRDMGCDAIELQCPVKEFHLMDTLKKKDLEYFKFISFHMPDISTSEKKIFDILKEVNKFHDKLNFDAITFHPSEVLHYQNILKSLKLPVSLENEDVTKKTGKSLKSLEEFMLGNKFRMTLDVNHCFTNDPTLTLAHDLWKNFKKRIDHFHLSGYGGIENELRHVPLFLTKQNQLIDFVIDKDLPIIIESVCRDLKEAESEFKLIKKYLSKNSNK